MEEKFPSWAIFQDKVKLLTALKSIAEFNDEGMLHSLQNTTFCSGVGNLILPRNEILLEDFDCMNFLRVLLPYKHYFAVAALANDLKQRKVIDSYSTVHFNTICVISFP